MQRLIEQESNYETCQYEEAYGSQLEPLLGFILIDLALNRELTAKTE